MIESVLPGPPAPRPTARKRHIRSKDKAIRSLEQVRDNVDRARAALVALPTDSRIMPFDDTLFALGKIERAAKALQNKRKPPSRTIEKKKSQTTPDKSQQPAIRSPTRPNFEISEDELFERLDTAIRKLNVFYIQGIELRKVLASQDIDVDTLIDVLVRTAEQLDNVVFVELSEPGKLDHSTIEQRQIRQDAVVYYIARLYLCTTHLTPGVGHGKDSNSGLFVVVACHVSKALGRPMSPNAINDSWRRIRYGALTPYKRAWKVDPRDLPVNPRSRFPDIG